MSNPLPPPPKNTPIADDSGDISDAYGRWFNQIYNIIGSAIQTAPSLGTYVINQANTLLPDAQNLSQLNSGFVKVTNGTGLLSSTGSPTIQSTDIANTGVGAGTYGNDLQTPIITVNAAGQITSAVNSDTILASNLSGPAILPTGTTIAIPTANTQIANKQYVDSVNAASITVRVYDINAETVTYFNGNLNDGNGATLTYSATGVVTIDSLTIALNDIVLFANQSNTVQNGIYKCTTAGAVGVAGVFTRTSDFNSPTTINSAGVISVKVGTVYAGSQWTCNSTVVTVGATGITFSVFSPLVYDSTISFSDITTNNASITQHGFQSKLPNIASDFEDGTGVWRNLASTDFVGGLTFSTPNFISPVIEDPGDNTKTIQFEIDTATTGTQTLLKAVQTVNRTITFPNATDTLIGKATTDVLTNKTYDTAGAGNVLKINTTQVSDISGSGKVVLQATPTITTPNITLPVIEDTGDTTKQLKFSLSGATTGTAVTLSASQAGNITLTLPVGGTDTLVARASTDTLSNKTLVAPALGTPASGTLTNCTGYKESNIVPNYTSWTSTFTTPSDSSTATIYRYRCMAGGGGGGGTNGGAAGAGGGGSGAYAEGTFTGVAASVSVTIVTGAAGSAGGNTGTNGTTGGVSSITVISPAISISCPGGVFSVGSTSGSGSAVFAGGAGGAAPTVSGQTSLINEAGGTGSPGMVVSGSFVNSGMGAPSPLGVGGAGGASAGTTVQPKAASGYGAGGGGGALTSSAGTAGSIGLVIVERISG